METKATRMDYFSADEQQIMRILAKSLTVAEDTAPIDPGRIRRYWVKDNGPTWVAFIEYTSDTPAVRIYKWHLSYEELLAYTKCRRNMMLHARSTRADEGLVYEYELQQQFLKFTITQQTQQTYQSMADSGVFLVPDDDKGPWKVNIENVIWTQTGGGKVPKFTGSVVSHIPGVVTLPLASPGEAPERAVNCTCSASFFCPEIEKWLGTPGNVTAICNDFSKFQLNGVGKFAIPLFGKVLHRVECGLTAQTDWEGNAYEELHVRIPTHRSEPTSRFFSMTDIAAGREHPFWWVVETVETDLKSDPILTDHRRVALEFMQNRGTHGCSSPNHNYGTTTALQKFLRSETIASNNVSAHVLCSAYYGKCYQCYMASELAHAVLPIDEPMF